MIPGYKKIFLISSGLDYLLNLILFLFFPLNSTLDHIILVYVTVRSGTFIFNDAFFVIYNARVNLSNQTNNRECGFRISISTNNLDLWFEKKKKKNKEIPLEYKNRILLHFFRDQNSFVKR